MARGSDRQATRLKNACIECRSQHNKCLSLAKAGCKHRYVNNNSSDQPRTLAVSMMRALINACSSSGMKSHICPSTSLTWASISSSVPPMAIGSASRSVSSSSHTSPSRFVQRSRQSSTSFWGCILSAGSHVEICAQPCVYHMGASNSHWLVCKSEGFLHWLVCKSAEHLHLSYSGVQAWVS